MTDREEPLSSEEMIRQARERIDEFEDLTDEPVLIEDEPVEEPWQAAPPPPSPPASDYEPFPEADQPQPPTKPWFRRGGVITAIVIGIFSAIGAFQSDGPERDSSGAVIEAGTLSVFEAQVGDCGNDPDPDADLIDTLEAVPCSNPHDIEVFSWVEYPDEPGRPYIGDEALFGWGFEQCYPLFEAYAGAPWESVLGIDIMVISPDAEAWEDDERSVMCAAIPPEGQPATAGSIRDAGPSAETIDLGTRSLFDIETGDCFDYSESVTSDLVPLKGCEGLHDFEVMAIPLYPAGADADYPGDDVLLDWSDSECGVQFQAVAGEAWTETSALSYFYFTPNAETWAEGDREVICLAATATGKKMVGPIGS